MNLELFLPRCSHRLVHRRSEFYSTILSIIKSTLWRVGFVRCHLLFYRLLPPPFLSTESCASLFKKRKESRFSSHTIHPITVSPRSILPARSPIPRRKIRPTDLRSQSVVCLQLSKGLSVPSQ